MTTAATAAAAAAAAAAKDSRGAGGRGRRAVAALGVVAVLGAAPAAGAADAVPDGAPVAGGVGSAERVLREARCAQLAGVDPARTGCGEHGPAATGSAPASAPGPADCVVPLADDRCESWRRTSLPGGPFLLGQVVAVPGSDRVHAVAVGTTGHRLLTLTADGEVVSDAALALPPGRTPDRFALSPDGATLHVAYRDRDQRSGLAAFATADGATRWSSGDAGQGATVLDVVASGDGRTVVASGYRVVDGMAQVVVTALDAATGVRRWTADWGTPTDDVYPYSLAVDRDASTTLVVGEAYDVQADRGDGLALALGRDGGVRWQERVRSADGGYGWFGGVALTTSGTAYVTGTQPGGVGAWAGTVRALDLADGRTRWATATATAPYSYTEVASPLVSPDGGRVHVVGTTTVGAGVPYVPAPAYVAVDDQDALAMAVDTASGQVLWSTRTGTPAHRSEGGYLAALSPDGSRLYQAGFSSNRGYGGVGVGFYAEAGDVTTTGFDAATGRRLWTARAGDGDPVAFGYPRGLVVLGGGQRVVTGALTGVVPVHGAVRPGRVRGDLLGYDG